MEPGVGELQFRLDADGSRDTPATDPVGQVAEQRALADARLPPQDQDAASTGPRVGDEPIKRLAFASTSKQPGRLNAVLAHRPLRGPPAPSCAGPATTVHRRPGPPAHAKPGRLPGSSPGVTQESKRVGQVVTPPCVPWGTTTGSADQCVRRVWRADETSRLQGVTHTHKEGHMPV